jgi:hypothetical protein
VKVTIDVWLLLPIAVGMFGLCMGLYERGQRKGMEEAENLFNPIIEKMLAKLNLKENIDDEA